MRFILALVVVILVPIFLTTCEVNGQLTEWFSTTTAKKMVSSDTRSRYRERRLQEQRRHLERNNIVINPEYEALRKTIDITADLYPGEVRRLVHQLQQQQAEEEAASSTTVTSLSSSKHHDAMVDEDVGFWDRFLQFGSELSLQTLAPTNRKPTATSAPIVAPTAAPFIVVTLSPVEPETKPTQAPFQPVAAPSPQPAPAPVVAPTSAPFAAPVAQPSSAPVFAPITVPFATPVSQPPSPAPVAQPSPAPITITSRPITAPTPAPIAPPTLRPVAPETRPPVPVTAAPVSSTPTATQVITPVALFGGAEFRDPLSYQSKSLAWLNSQSSYTNSLPSNRIIQRYGLGCIYYATYNVSTTFTNIALNGSIFGWTVGRDRGWLTPTDECTWANILCQNSTESSPGSVKRLDFFAALLTGEFPPEVVYFKNTLANLDLGNNFVFTRGTTFNSYLGQLTQLARLQYGNTNFISETGVPTELGLLKKLEYYSCSNVRYVGALNGAAFPSDLSALSFMELEYNAFNSPIPSQVGSLPALEFFYARGSNITGNLDFMRNMRRIKECWTDQNPALGGTLPTFLGSLSTLASLSVTECNWNGPLPSELGLLTTSMQQMFFFNNKFSGTVPSSWTAFQNLVKLEMQLNTLQGTIPTGLCQQVLGGRLTDLKADCTICPNVGFKCCTTCFDAQGNPQ